MKREDGEQVASTTDVMQWAFGVIMFCGHSEATRWGGFFAFCLVLALRVLIARKRK